MFTNKMLFLPLALLISAAIAIPIQAEYSTTFHTNTQQSSNTSSIPRRLCGVAQPSYTLMHAHHVMRLVLDKRDFSNIRNFTVDTVFHIVTTQDQAGSVSKTMIANQFGALQSAYASSSIGFHLLNVTYTVNDAWATDAADSEMKSALRVGNYSTLNIYFQSNLSTNSLAGASSQLLGYCSLPTNVTYTPCDGCPPTEVPAYDYFMDGCNVHAGSMPNGRLPGYSQGKTAIHEVGHWFGLLHTFQDETCDPSDPGDFIDDTPQEALSTDGCPVGKKSCQDCVGLDPIHNFMDYSSDDCYENFTPQQIVRMQDMFTELRLGF